jgi:hypothetical protein
MRRSRADRRSKSLLGSLFLTMALLLPSAAFGRSVGIDTNQMFDGVVTCGGGISGFLCHSVGSNAVFVTITGPDSLVLDESAVYTIEVFETVQGSGALQAGAGLNVVAIIDEVLTDISDGVLSEENANTRITNGSVFVGAATGQLTHVNARSPLADGSLGVTAYDFTVTAPSSPATLELRGNMNAFNGDFLQFLDNWNGTSLIVTVPEPAATSLAAAALVTLIALRRRGAAC